jgi:membrane protease subunit HflC
MSRLLWRAGLALGVLIAVGLWNGIYVIGPTDEVLVVRLGRPVAAEQTPGLRLKVPFIDTLITYDNRLLPLEPPSEQIILGDQKRVEIDTYTRFRIADPLHFYQSVGTLDAARSQLGQTVSSSLRRRLGQINLGSLLSADRDQVVGDIRKDVAVAAQPLGIDVVDVRIRRADLPPETSQAIFDRMKSERQREAKDLRARGQEWQQEVQAKADRERTVLLAEAQRQASINRGEGDAEANRIFADAFGRDPQFFDFFRSLKTYRDALAQSQPTLLLTPDSEFMRFFNGGSLGTPPTR